VTRSHPRHLAFEVRLKAGYSALAAADASAALAHFEAAHILGQASTWRHVRSHMALFRWGWQQSDRREMRGQVGRLVGATLFTWLWVPVGNPGSTRIGAFAPHPVPAELRTLLEGE
jgi:hypothetical protein